MPKNRSDFIQSLIDRGLDESLAEEIENWNDASPLRAAAKSYEKRNKDLEEDNKKLRARITKQVFAEAGIKVNPDVLNLPDDLDITDTGAVSTWALEMGLKSNSPSVPQEELENLDAQTDLQEGGDSPQSGVITPTMAADWAVDKAMKFRLAHPDAWELLKRGEEVRGVPA